MGQGGFALCGVEGDPHRYSVVTETPRRNNRPHTYSRRRPPSPSAKRLVTVRLDPDLLDRMRATGPGWQTRLNEAVRVWLGKKSA